jgi:hypothetical protein
MGIAISSGKIGFAYLVDGELMDWGLSIKARRGAEAAFDKASDWIGYYQLELLVMEDPIESRKGPHALILQDAVLRAATAAKVEVVLLPRAQDSPNKYAEAMALAEEFPQLASWVPAKRRLWETEPRYIILFEALSLAWNWWRSSDAPMLDSIEF